MWDPAVYGRYGDERSRPFFELVGRIPAEAPEQVVDLGCGPGTLTATLAARWPDALVRGIDSSPEMIAAADELNAPVDFAVGERGGQRARAAAKVDDRAGPLGRDPGQQVVEGPGAFVAVAQVGGGIPHDISKPYVRFV